MGLEGVVHDEPFDVGGKLLARTLRCLDDDLQEQLALPCAVVVVVEPDACCQCAQWGQAGDEGGQFAVVGCIGHHFAYDGRQVAVLDGENV